MKIKVTGEQGQVLLETSVDEFPVIIGRVSPAKIIVPDNDVSRTHVELNWDGTSLTARDLKSSNGTFFEDQKIDTQVLLLPGKLRLGTTINVEFTAEPSDYYNSSLENTRTMVFAGSMPKVVKTLAPKVETAATQPSITVTKAAPDAKSQPSIRPQTQPSIRTEPSIRASSVSGPKPSGQTEPSIRSVPRSTEQRREPSPPKGATDPVIGAWQAIENLSVRQLGFAVGISTAISFLVFLLIEQLNFGEALVSTAGIFVAATVAGAAGAYLGSFPTRWTGRDQNRKPLSVAIFCLVTVKLLSPNLAMIAAATPAGTFLIPFLLLIFGFTILAFLFIWAMTISPLANLKLAGQLATGAAVITVIAAAKMFVFLPRSTVLEAVFKGTDSNLIRVIGGKTGATADLTRDLLRTPASP